MNYYIKTKSYKNNEYEGEWNGKYYDSKIPKGKYDFLLFRIYVNDKEINIKEEQRIELESLKAKLNIPEKLVSSRAYIFETLQLATNEEIFNEIKRRKLKMVEPTPIVKEKEIIKNRFEVLEIQ
jgi:Zn-dependent peptidase ImmA (M78 family)